MMGAQHSIRILAWELSFRVGLVTLDELPAAARAPFTHADTAPAPPPASMPAPAALPALSAWVTLEDVVLSKAREGVRVALVIWRHEWLSTLDRVLVTLREASFERELEAVRAAAHHRGLRMGIFHRRDSDRPIVRLCTCSRQAVLTLL